MHTFNIWLDYAHYKGRFFGVQVGNSYASCSQRSFAAQSAFGGGAVWMVGASDPLMLCNGALQINY